jgi:hypothetical protein
VCERERVRERERKRKEMCIQMKARKHEEVVISRSGVLLTGDIHSLKHCLNTCAINTLHTTEERERKRERKREIEKISQMP